MNSKLWIQKALSTCTLAAVITTSSMLAFATDSKTAAELTVIGQSSVTVNGEAAKSGRTIFSNSLVTTTADSSALINAGNAGEIELAPNSAMTISFDGSSINVDLTAGRLAVVKASNAVDVKTVNSSVKLNAGESAVAGAGKTDDDYRDSSGKCIDADKDGKEECGKGGGAWWLWALVMGGAAGGIIYAVTSDDNDVSLGGGGTVVSPVR